jgi:hypothetical protein
MTLRRSLSVALFVVSLAALFSLQGSAKRAVEGIMGGQQKAVIFAVYGAGSAGASARMEPILIIEGGKFKEPVSGGSEAAEITRFTGEYYRKGQKYRVLFGGAEAGGATVQKSTRDEECFRTGAEITLRTDARLNRNVMALATDSGSLGLAAAERSRRTPSPNERSQALELARSAFRQKGVAASLLPSIEVINLTAIDLDRDGTAELAGSFVVSKRTRKQERYVLFLLALPQGAGYKATVSNFEKYGEDAIMSGASISAINEGLYVERLVDHLDLDGDRTSELMTISTGLEGVTYYIYKRQNGAWSRAYEFGNYRCAF